jgi:hypothetical protein
VSNAVRKFYNATWVASVSANEVLTTTALPTLLDRNEGSSPIFTITVPFLINKYNESVSLLATGRSAAGQTGTLAIPTAIRIDTVSGNEPALRVQSGTGTFPTFGAGPAGYGSIFVSTVSLTTSEELQLRNGLFLYPPSVNYSTSIPSGPNYTAVATTPAAAATARWVTFNVGTITNQGNVVVTLLNATGISNPISAWQCQITVQGVIGWLDLNAAYPGVGTPVANGDPCLAIALSSATVKYATFGPVVRTGPVYVRIGLAPASPIQFSGVSVTFI